MTQRAQWVQIGTNWGLIDSIEFYITSMAWLHHFGYQFSNGIFLINLQIGEGLQYHIKVKLSDESGSEYKFGITHTL